MHITCGRWKVIIVKYLIQLPLITSYNPPGLMALTISKRHSKVPDIIIETQSVSEVFSGGLQQISPLAI